MGKALQGCFHMSNAIPRRPGPAAQTCEARTICHVHDYGKVCLETATNIHAGRQLCWTHYTATQRGPRALGEMPPLEYKAP
jgi:hypothetical protein